jgi:hypothetical protein
MKFNRNSYQNRHPWRPRQKNNIETVLKEKGCEGMGWIQMAQDVKRRDFMNVVMNLPNSIQGGGFFSPCERNGIYGAQ